MGAALFIAQRNLDDPQPWIALAGFVVLASTFIALPLFYYLLARATAEKTLTGWKDWFIINNSTASIVLYLMLGAKFIGDGLGGLFGQ